MRVVEVGGIMGGGGGLVGAGRTEVVGLGVEGGREGWVSSPGVGSVMGAFRKGSGGGVRGCQRGGVGMRGEGGEGTSKVASGVY